MAMEPAFTVILGVFWVLFGFLSGRLASTELGANHHY